MEDSGAAPTFLTFTTLSDMNSDEARTTVASHAARIGRQRRRMRVVADPQNISHSFHLWRAFGYAATSRRKPRNDQRSEPEREPEREPEWPAAQAPPFYGNPLSLVGQGRKDPFAKFAVPHISDLGQEVLDHGTSGAQFAHSSAL